MTIHAEPYNWPFDGNLKPNETALIIIDMQNDFCKENGYVSQMGYDISLTSSVIDPIKSLLETFRQIPELTVIHTREGHRPDLSDLPANKKWRSESIKAGIGSQGPNGKILVRGEPGWDIIPELKPIEGEIILDKPGKGCFYATDLDLILRTQQVKNLILAGVTTDVCVHTTMREANDRGYECVLLEDCTAATYPSNHEAALNMVKTQGGVFGCVSSSSELKTYFSQFIAEGVSK